MLLQVRMTRGGERDTKIGSFQLLWYKPSKVLNNMIIISFTTSHSFTFLSFFSLLGLIDVVLDIEISKQNQHVHHDESLH